MLLYVLDEDPLIVLVVVCKVRNDLLVLLDKVVDDVSVEVVHWLLGGSFGLHHAPWWIVCCAAWGHLVQEVVVVLLRHLYCLDCVGIYAVLELLHCRRFLGDCAWWGLIWWCRMIWHVSMLIGMMFLWIIHGFHAKAILCWDRLNSLFAMKMYHFYLDRLIFLILTLRFFFNYKYLFVIYLPV